MGGICQKQSKVKKAMAVSNELPIEAPDSIQSISRTKLLIALSEGEFAGGLDGTNCNSCHM
ncbi:hypothetical protein TI10_15380 [Photorhabdus luminescens subsp. luminescens]|nr:hypothetical protein TI10_15380 [Photorhabdus luminescens subsp. luminescens]